MRHECRNCVFFACEVMRWDGKPMEDRGECNRSATTRKFIDSDDWCNKWKIATWATEEGGEE